MKEKKLGRSLKPTCWRVEFTDRFGMRHRNYECYGRLMTAKELLDHYGNIYGCKEVSVERISDEEYLKKRFRSGVIKERKKLPEGVKYV